MGEFTQCNFCTLNYLYDKYKDRELILLAEDSWISLYLIGEQPESTENIQEHQGKPIKFLASFMAITDHCVC